MAWRARSFTVGILRATVYTAEKAGDAFGDHEHDEATNHISIVLFGGVTLTGHEDHAGDVLTVGPGGAIKSWEPGKLHGWIAGCDGATIMSMLTAALP